MEAQDTNHDRRGWPLGNRRLNARNALEHSGAPYPAHRLLSPVPTSDPNTDDIAAGDTVTFTLTDEDGKDYELTDVPVRVQQSGYEDYGTDGMKDREGM